MASQCPKCHQVIEDDVVCCAGLKKTWKCKSCGKLTEGFVVPYGRCFLCGGDNEVVEPYPANQPDVVLVVEEAVRYELEMYHFYKLAKERTTSPELREVLEDLYLKEVDHLEELDTKYHVHLDPNLRELTPDREKLLAGWIFEGIDFEDGDEHVVALYDVAIDMERRTRDHFKARAEALPAGTEKEIFRELAAEEEEHVALLESERQHWLSDGV